MILLTPYPGKPEIVLATEGSKNTKKAKTKINLLKLASSSLRLMCFLWKNVLAVLFRA